MTQPITPADLEAICDVLTQVGETSDTLDVESAVAIREALQAVGSANRAALGLVDTQLVSVLESPRQFGNLLYEIVSNGKWRPLHNKITAEVKRQSLVDTETGELLDAEAAVERCISILYALFVANATFPKTGGLDALGLDKGDVGHYEQSGKKVRTTDVAPDD